MDQHSPHPDQASPAWAFKILIDGGCALCAREATLLEKLDRERGRLVMENIADPDFDPSRYGKTYEQVMAHIHGVLPDGTVIEGMEVFRRAYAAVGWGWLLAPTALPVLRPVFDALYRLFARIRLKLPGNRKRCEINPQQHPGATPAAGSPG